MVKRAVNQSAASLLGARVLNRLERLGRAVVGALSDLNPGKDAEGRFCRPAAVEPLESRLVLSVGFGPIVDVAWQGRTAQAVEGQYLAQTLHTNAFFQLAQNKGFTNIRALGGTGFYAFDSHLSPQIIARIGQSHPTALAAVQPNFVVHAADTVPNDNLGSLQWALHNTGQVELGVTGTVGDDINARKAWDVTTGSSSVVVAVLDTGIDTGHPDLAPNLFTNPGDATANNIDNDNNGFIDDVHGWNFVADSNNVTDDNGHGTNVSGIIGAVGNNHRGITGVNWSVKLLPVKVLGADGLGSEEQIVSGINYITTLREEGVNIVAINESIGNSAGFPFDVVTSKAIKEAGAAGILDVVAAGNDASDLNANPLKPAGFSRALPNVITVAAVDNQFNLASFSDFGAELVDLGAPGVNILSTAPTYTVFEPPTPLDPNTPLGGYGFESGTSQATPQVAGIIALEAAANPNATPAQYKKALLDGVTFDPALGAVNGLPPKVRTVGVANAFNAVKNILNQFAGSDLTRRGNWHNFFGSQGAYVVGESTTFPEFVTASFDGASLLVPHGSIRNPSALQKVANPADRVTAYEASTTTETINLAFTDGNAHRVGLYVVDLDHKRRTETIQLIDPVTAQVFDTQTVSNFKKGEYLFWDVRGTVQLKITNVGGPNAVFSGIFFDTPPSNPNAFQGLDTTTGGFNWRNRYGSQGQFIVGDNNTQTLPSYVGNLSPSTNAVTKVLRPISNSPIALQREVDVNHGIMAYWSAVDQFDINLSFTDTVAHQVTLYAADFDHRHRSERIEAINAVSGSVLFTQDLVKFDRGAFVSFAVSGSVIFRVINSGGTNAVVSGVFFDAPPGEKLHYEGVDATTRGNWKTTPYGLTNAFVIGDNFPGIDDLNPNPDLSEVGATERILADPATDPRALLKLVDTVTSLRVAAYAFTTSTITLNLTFTDHGQHQLALYFVDYERLHRSQLITLTDPVTGQVLAKQRLANFAGGKYLVYQVRGSVTVTITNETYPNAVLSGVFTT